jgi:hypothetical protein
MAGRVVLEPVPAVRAGASQRATTNHSKRDVVRSPAAITPLFVLFPSLALADHRQLPDPNNSLRFGPTKFRFVSIRNAFGEFETVLQTISFFVFLVT